MPIGNRIDPAAARPAPAPAPQAAEVKKKEEKQGPVFESEAPHYTLDDLIVPQHVLGELLDVADYLANSKVVFEQWGLEETHKYSKRLGINLYGPPGTGKTLAAHAIAAYMGRRILCVNYADIESKYVGETPKNIHRVFEVAKKDNSIIFFDEADAILSRRVTNMNNATDVSVNQTRSVLLTILNDYQGIIIFATNFIENFDPAFMRRISKHVHIGLPDEDCRRRLWRKYIPAKLPHSIDIERVARDYDGVTGSDIANAVLMAAFHAARNHDSAVPHAYIEKAISDIQKSKQANAKNSPVVTKREVSAEYVREELARKEN